MLSSHKRKQTLIAPSQSWESVELGDSKHSTPIHSTSSPGSTDNNHGENDSEERAALLASSSDKKEHSARRPSCYSVLLGKLIPLGAMGLFLVFLVLIASGGGKLVFSQPSKESPSTQDGFDGGARVETKTMPTMQNQTTGTESTAAATVASTTTTPETSSSLNAAQYLQQASQQDFCAKRTGTKFFSFDFPTNHSLDHLLEGPALTKIKNQKRMEYAVCKFRPPDGSNNETTSLNFPHTLQQLVRCVSWWQYHRERQQQLQSSSAASTTKGESLTLVLVWPKTGMPARVDNAEWIRGVVHALRRVWEVRVVPLRGQVPLVRAPIEYGKYWYGQEQQSQGLASTTAALGAALRQKHWGYQTRRVSDLQRLRQDMIKTLAPSRHVQEMALLDDAPQDPTLVASKPLPKIVILNRKPQSSSGRSVLNVEALLEALNNRLKGGEVSSVQVVPYTDEESSFGDQVSLMATTDILISPHGSQLSSLFLMPPCGSVLELFGRGYFVPEFYGSLAAASGLRYHALYTSTTLDGTADADATDSGIMAEIHQGMKSHQSRTVAKHFPVCAPIEVVVEQVVTEVQVW
eukprot:CAMPEP_0168755320 /NCGR_PEP_ID=MMETSP0724-20121128/20001_1 /TAXON_ID=265536 /ORGANISM="Amphiprora sp., Strain CCMP467" /LENGTH=576 /DNA_ID=CAMNT_0008803917 /DNA_START=264 /DNA_END=1991 /DNA_ORIENTATION=+